MVLRGLRGNSGSVLMLRVHLASAMHSLNAVKWKSTLLAVILGITSFGVEIHLQNSGIHSKVVV